MSFALIKNANHFSIICRGNVSRFSLVALNIFNDDCGLNERHLKESNTSI